MAARGSDQHHNRHGRHSHHDSGYDARVGCGLCDLFQGAEYQAGLGESDRALYLKHMETAHGVGVQVHVIGVRAQ